MPEYKTDCELSDASEDVQRYIKIFNRSTGFAPYTIPLTEKLVEEHLLSAYDGSTQLWLIGSNSQGEGIIHAGLYNRGQQNEAGLVYALFGDNNKITVDLLMTAEKWFREKGQDIVRACNWRPNPYKYILHGSETYVWGGAMHTINAYRRLNYDLEDESIIMICNMDAEPEVPAPDMQDIVFTNEKVLDNSLVYKSTIKAFVEGKQAGHCTYDYLKAISDYFRKPIGQISINIGGEYYGKGLGKTLLLSAHRELYRLGARQVMLHTVQRLFRAVKLYEKTGYREQNIRGYCFIKEIREDS